MISGVSLIKIFLLVIVTIIFINLYRSLFGLNYAKKKLKYYKYIESLQVTFTDMIAYCISSLPRKYFNSNNVHGCFVVSDNNKDYKNFYYYCRIQLSDQIIDESRGIDFENVSLRITDNLRNVDLFKLDTEMNEEEYSKYVEQKKITDDMLDSIYLLNKLAKTNTLSINDLMFF